MPEPNKSQRQLHPLTPDQERIVRDIVDWDEGCYSHRFIRRRDGVVKFIFTSRDLDPWNVRKAFAISAQIGIVDKWTRDQLLKLVNGDVSGVVGKAEPGPRTNWERDADIFLAMHHWLRQWRPFKNRPEKPRPFTLDMAAQKVAEEFAAKGLRIQPSTVKSAYLRTRKRFLVISVLESDLN
jgi:hypothetical protein